jgi:hypothetical protein
MQNPMADARRPPGADARTMAVTSPLQRLAPAARAAALVLLAIAVGAVVVVFDPLASAARAVAGVLPDLPDLPDLAARPDLPWWLKFVVGPGKVVLVVALFVFAGAAEARRRRGHKGEEDR